MAEGTSQSAPGPEAGRVHRGRRQHLLPQSELDTQGPVSNGTEKSRGQIQTRDRPVQVGDHGTGTSSGDEDGAPDIGLSVRLGRTERAVGTLCRKVQSQAQRLWGDTSQDAGVPWWGGTAGRGIEEGSS